MNDQLYSRWMLDLCADIYDQEHNPDSPESINEQNLEREIDEENNHERNRIE